MVHNLFKDKYICLSTFYRPKTNTIRYNLWKKLYYFPKFVKCIIKKLWMKTHLSKSCPSNMCQNEENWKERFRMKRLTTFRRLTDVTNGHFYLLVSMEHSWCPWSMGCSQKTFKMVWFLAKGHLPRVSRRSLMISDNEMILGAVHRSPGICLNAEKNPGKPQLGYRLMKGLSDQSLPQMGFLSSK